MAEPPITVRVARTSDAPELLALYAYYVEHTAISFEDQVPDAAEFARRIQHTLAYYPYLVAERAGELVGYAYAGRFKERAAYDWAVESSIYVRRDQKRTGVGRMLYAALEALLRTQGILDLYACIAMPQGEDVYLTADSAAFHEHVGYRQVCRFPRCGYKFGRWYDIIWMQKSLGAHTAEPAPVRPFCEIEGALEQFTKNS